MRETIKKYNGMVVGYIEDKGDRLVATNFSGIVLGPRTRILGYSIAEMKESLK